MNDVATQQRPTWPQFIEQAAPQFNAIADHNQLVTWAEESQFAIQAIEKNQKLAECLPHTVKNSVINVAAVGLTLNPALGYAYLVPEGVKQPNGQFMQECLLRVSFKGLLKIATDSGSIKWAKAEVVKEHDTFIYKGPCTMPEHQMQPFGDRGATVGAYCIAKTHEGDFLVDIMNGEQIQKIRNAAKTKYVWDAWPDEMAKKAIIKRASKQWPKTDRDDRLDLAVAAVNDDEGSEDLPQRERDITPKNDAPETVNDDQIERLKAAITLADGTVESFCEKVAKIPSIDQLPAQRFEAAMNFLKQRAQSNSETEAAQ